MSSFLVLGVVLAHRVLIQSAQYTVLLPVNKSYAYRLSDLLSANVVC